MTVTSFNVPDLPFADAAALQQQAVERQNLQQRQQEAREWLQGQFGNYIKPRFSAPRIARQTGEFYLPFGTPQPE